LLTWNDTGWSHEIKHQLHHISSLRHKLCHFGSCFSLSNFVISKGTSHPGVIFCTSYDRFTFVLFFPIWKVPKSQRVSELFALNFRSWTVRNKYLASKPY
jgi:hypothetical protein